MGKNGNYRLGLWIRKTVFIDVKQNMTSMLISFKLILSFNVFSETPWKEINEMNGTMEIFQKVNILNFMFVGSAEIDSMDGEK